MKEGALEPGGGEREVGLGPGGPEALLDGGGVVGLALGAPAPGEPEERPAVLAVPLEVLTVNRFGRGGPAGDSRRAKQGSRRPTR